MTDRVSAPRETSDAGFHSASKKSAAYWVSNLLREPLTHFLLIGAALFAVDAYLRDDEVVGNEPIVVTAGKIEQLAALFSRTWQRTPTREEVRVLVKDYVLEETAYREGVKLGLDRGDTVIRRRIRQKLDFVAKDLASQISATEDQLATYLETHSDDFRVEARFSFRQVFFNREKHGNELDEIVGALVGSLRDDPALEADSQGDATLLEFRYENVSQREVADVFGNDFAAALVELEPVAWHGPVESAYGVHVVRVDEILPGRLPRLEEVRHAVHRAWETERERVLTEEFYSGLLKEYDIVIEWPEVAAEDD